jgi:uncharacterized protein
MKIIKKSIITIFIVIVCYSIANGVRIHFFKPDEMFLDIEQTYLLNLFYLPVFMGITVLVILIMIYIFKKKISILSILVFIISLSFIFLYIYTSSIEPVWLKVRKYNILTDKINNQITIIHISDIQSGRLGRYEEKVFKLISNLNPDIVINTGDLIQPFNQAEYKKEFKKISSLFKQLTLKCNVYNVSGNIDSRVELLQFDKNSGVKTLENMAESIKIKDTYISLLGLSWPASLHGNNNLIKDWAYNNNNFRIIFGHSPDYILTAKDYPIELALAGHTHGGQICMPFYGPLFTFSKVPASWAVGYRKVNDINFNVSSGVGAEHGAGIRSIRLFCRPEITVFTLIPE